MLLLSGKDSGGSEKLVQRGDPGGFLRSRKPAQREGAHLMDMAGRAEKSIGSTSEESSICVIMS